MSAGEYDSISRPTTHRPQCPILFPKEMFLIYLLFIQEYGDSLNCQAGCSKETGSKDRYNNRSYESFVKNGFADAIPRSISGPHDRMQKFLSIVDLRKGPGKDLE